MKKMIGTIIVIVCALACIVFYFVLSKEKTEPTGENHKGVSSQSDVYTPQASEGQTFDKEIPLDKLLVDSTKPFTRYGLTYTLIDYKFTKSAKDLNPKYIDYLGDVKYDKQGNILDNSYYLIYKIKIKNITKQKQDVNTAVAEPFWKDGKQHDQRGFVQYSNHNTDLKGSHALYNIFNPNEEKEFIFASTLNANWALHQSCPIITKNSQYYLFLNPIGATMYTDDQQAFISLNWKEKWEDEK
ncbi:hypothetical protein RBG61_09340 [Paludicola sp. MB14-C6]|uniref:hypothetical protein n=1 Tax=Paludihabitans sp. MB14-C6 TaxID=3070656 RepID=UPI0027DBCC21|nr:hypothetical protein [Paludicola sp. MB14-C6]WMJ22200.1 hypothetical protein RBG61_09340 [Paludicola sp. MB14-C6]